jgi:hypothetical protein
VSALQEMIYEAVQESVGRRDERRRDAERDMNALTRQPVGTGPQTGTGGRSGAPDEAEDDLPNEPDVNPYDETLLKMLVDWPEFWARDQSEADWIAEPVIPAGRSISIYAPGGTGKSLFTLSLVAAVATGGAGLDGRPMKARRVLYIDYEMTQEDLFERLSAMGYDQTCDLSNLHYASLPSLPAADAPEGGKAIARMAQLVDAELVILDTFSRAVAGDENDADTVRSFYRWTGLHLKAEGRAFIRIDHAGKDIERGQRGTSAKNDDVDIVWQMIKADASGFKLTAKKRRMGWVPEVVELQQFDEPTLHYRIVEGLAPSGTDKVVRDLDELGVPAFASARQASKLLKDGGRGARDQLVRAAQKKRLRGFGEAVDNSPNQAQNRVPPNRDAYKVSDRDAARDAPLRNGGLPAGTRCGTHPDAGGDATGTRSVTLVTDAPSVAGLSRLPDTPTIDALSVAVDW